MNRNPYEPPNAEVGEEAPIAQQGDLFSRIVVVYDARFIDLWRFVVAHQLRSIPFQIFYGGLALLFTRSTIQQMDCDPYGSCVPIAGFSFLIVYGIMILIQFLLNGLFLFARNNRTAFTRHRVELTPEGVSEETQYKRSLFLWPGIRKVVAGRRIVAVYVTAHAAVVIPNSSFASAEQREFFIRTIKTKMQTG